MAKIKYFVGVDIASATFVACVGMSPWKVVVRPEEFDNQEDGFVSFLGWLKKHNLPISETVVCMEATGVYGEGLAYFLSATDYAVAVEPPLNIQKKFPSTGNKNDWQDSQNIAEYACRYVDKLSFWQPRNEILEQIKLLLTTRQQLTVQSTAQKNALHAVNRKKVSSPLAKKVHHDMIQQIRKHIKTIDAEVRNLIDNDPTFKQTVLLLISIPGIGMTLAAHLLIMTQHSLDPRELAAYLGICPYEHKSGSSVNRKSTSRHYGPAAARKLLYLAACSVRTHRKEFKQYFLRKTAEGKPGKLVINNIQNKLLKIACAVLRTQKPFIPNHVSVSPMLLKGA